MSRAIPVVHHCVTLTKLPDGTFDVYYYSPKKHLSAKNRKKADSQVQAWQADCECLVDGWGRGGAVRPVAPDAWPPTTPFPPTVRIRFDPPMDLLRVSEVTLHRTRHEKKPTFVVYIEERDGNEMWDLVARPAVTDDGIPTVTVDSTFGDSADEVKS